MTDTLDHGRHLMFDGERNIETAATLAPFQQDETAFAVVRTERLSAVDYDAFTVPVMPLPANPSLLVGEDVQRKRVFVVNASNVNVRIGKLSQLINPSGGFLLPPAVKHETEVAGAIYGVMVQDVAATAVANPVVIAAPGVITVNGNSATIDTAAFGTDVSGLSIPLNVSALGAGPGQTVTVALQESQDGIVWADVTTVVLTALGTFRLAAAGPLARFVRLAWRAVAGGGLTVDATSARFTTYGEQSASTTANAFAMLSVWVETNR